MLAEKDLHKLPKYSHKITLDLRNVLARILLTENEISKAAMSKANLKI